MAATPDKYEQLYRAERRALGAPEPALEALWTRFDGRSLNILDAGCGQGRDALPLARRGHRVVGVDSAPTGIAQMLEEARAEGLAVEGVVADLEDFEPTGPIDLIVCDRILHMLSKPTRRKVLGRLLDAAAARAFVIVVDERRNMGAIRDQCRAAGFTMLEETPRMMLAARETPIDG